ncbi:UNVERIFIED_CONTAM: aspartate kinase [Acetivibrio alkalicellulosi]
MYKIAGNLDRLKGTISEGNIYTDEAMGKILNAVAKAYFAQLNIFDKLLSEKHGVVINKVLSEAMTGYNVKVSHLFMSPVEVNEGGMYIDVDRNAKSVISLNGDKEAQKAYMIASGMIGSAMEHIIFEQMTNVPSVSSIKVLQQANARGIPIHMVTTENINEVLPILEVSNSVKRDIRDSVNAGRIVQIPERNIQYFDWYGTGSAGYMISGGIAGGAMSVGEVLVRYFTYVVSGLITMALFHIAGILILSVTPIGWLGAVLMIGKVLKYALIGIVLISFIYNATRLIEFYRVTGDVYYLQELLIQISSLTSLLALNFGPFKGINQEIHVLKHTIIQMKQIGIPAKITFQFAATYGMGRIDPATKAIKFFKDYGLSNSAIETIGKSFDSKGIALIETTFIKSAITYTGSEANTIIILFKQAGNINAATTLSNSLINLSKSGIIPSTFNNYGIMSNITSITEASDALVKGITSPLIKKLFGHGIKPTDYNTLGITNPQMADAVDQIAERYGADGLNALQKGIKPDLINRLADNGIRPVNYESMGITTPQMAETVAEALGRRTIKILDEIADSTIVSRVKEIRGLLPSDLKRSGNFGIAEVQIPGIKNELYAHSGIDVLEDARSAANNVSDITLKPTNPTFKATSVPTSDGTMLFRDMDTEYKILNNIAETLGDNTSVSGKIRLFTERPCCDSCSNVILEFLQKYKNITIEVVHNNGTILKP